MFPSKGDSWRNCPGGLKVLLDYLSPGQKLSLGETIQNFSIRGNIPSIAL